MEIEQRTPWQIPVGIAVLAASFLPVWLINLDHAPTESRIRFWTTMIVALASWGIVRRMTFFRWFLLVLLGTGIVISIWSFVTAFTIELQSILITLAQTTGLGLLFTPGANGWFRKPAVRADAPVR